MANRGTVWGEEEVRVLISIWGDEKIQDELDGPRRKQSLHEAIAKELQKKGFNRDAEQCKIKIKNLKSQYRPIKDHNNKSGNDKKTFKFFDELDIILGHRPSSKPPVVLDACAGGILAALPEAREESNSESGEKTYSITVSSYKPFYAYRT